MRVHLREVVVRDASFNMERRPVYHTEGIYGHSRGHTEARFDVAIEVAPADYNKVHALAGETRRADGAVYLVDAQELEPPRCYVHDDCVRSATLGRDCWRAARARAMLHPELDADDGPRHAQRGERPRNALVKLEDDE